LMQHENEWTMMIYARTVFPQFEWTNEYGERVDAIKLIEELLQRELHHGACAATHRLEALVLLLRADDQAKALPPELRQRILDHLRNVSKLLVESQFREGFWTRYWTDGEEALDKEIGGDYDRLLATGHHLEWMALAPPEVLPPRENIVRAAQWAVRTMLEIDEGLLDQKFGPLTHVARALCLWRGMEPYDAWRKLKRKQAETAGEQRFSDFTLPSGGSRGTSGEGRIASRPRFAAALPGRYRVRPSQGEGEADRRDSIR